MVRIPSKIYILPSPRWNIYGSLDSFFVSMIYSDIAAEQALDSDVYIVCPRKHLHYVHNIDQK